MGFLADDWLLKKPKISVIGSHSNLMIVITGSAQNSGGSLGVETGLDIISLL